MFQLTNYLARSAALRQSVRMLNTSAKKNVNLKVVSVNSVTREETFDEKNKRLGRQLSPHLSIYKPQLTSILSISHRVAGCALTSGVWALGLGALFLPHDMNHYITMIEGLNMSDTTLALFKFTMFYPFSFHMCNGIRHLLWDSGRFLKISEVYSTGYAIMILSVIIAGGVAFGL